MRKKIASTVLLAVLLLPMFSVLPVTFAATDEEIEESIVAGLIWLAGQQNDDGSWGDYEQVAHTGLAVLKFIDRARELDEDPFSDEYEYHLQVMDGLDYIFQNADTMNITDPQPHGDPDVDGDGLGVYFEIDSWHRTYSTGICLMAVSAADISADRLGNPSPVVAMGPLTGWTYEDVIRDTVDYLAFGQNDGGSERGGWGYNENYDWSDNSNSGWATLGLGYAMASGATIPQFVYDELEIWIDYIQNDVDGDAEDGGSGYQVPDSWVNMLKTGNLLYQMRLVGDTVDTQRVIDAIDYQERHWNDANWDPGWKGPGWGANNWTHHQATFCIMKGFEAFGVDLIDLDDDDIPEHDWFDDISTRIVQTQNPDGSWFYDEWGDDILSTTWALLTLEKVVEVPRIPVYVDIKPGSWPNPINKGSKGVFAVAICGTEDFDIMTIDPGTVKIHVEGVEDGVPPLRWSYEDAATPYTGEPGSGHDLEGDGYVDLVLHFKTQEVVDTLGLCEFLGEKTLIIRGNLYEEYDVTAIEGRDYVRLQAPKGKGKP